MFKPKWRKILCFDTDNSSTVYWLWGTKREARKYAKEMRKRGYNNAYIITRKM